LTIASYRAQDRRVALRRHGIDGDDGAADVALVDAQTQTAHAQAGARPGVPGERCLLSCLHEDVRPETLDVEPGADALAELGNRLGGDEREREGAEDPAFLLDHPGSARTELGPERRIRDVEEGPRRSSHH